MYLPSYVSVLFLRLSSFYSFETSTCPRSTLAGKRAPLLGLPWVPARLFYSLYHKRNEFEFLSSLGISLWPMFRGGRSISSRRTRPRKIDERSCRSSKVRKDIIVSVIILPFLLYLWFSMKNLINFINIYFICTNLEFFNEWKFVIVIRHVNYNFIVRMTLRIVSIKELVIWILIFFKTTTFKRRCRFLSIILCI